MNLISLFAFSKGALKQAVVSIKNLSNASEGTTSTGEAKSSVSSKHSGGRQREIVLRSYQSLFLVYNLPVVEISNLSGLHRFTDITTKAAVGGSMNSCSGRVRHFLNFSFSSSDHIYLPMAIGPIGCLHPSQKTTPLPLE